MGQIIEIHNNTLKPRLPLHSVKSRPIRFQYLIKHIKIVNQVVLPGHEHESTHADPCGGNLRGPHWSQCGLQKCVNEQIEEFGDSGYLIKERIQLCIRKLALI